MSSYNDEDITVKEVRVALTIACIIIGMVVASMWTYSMYAKTLDTFILHIK